MTRRRSLLASFGYGVLIASGTTGSLVALHHALAPPPAETAVSHALHAKAVTPEAGAVTAPQAERWDRNGITTTALPKTQAAPARPEATPVSGSTGEAHRALTLGIQRELRRVGCFTGEADGEWTATTRSAMRTFNDVIRVQLPTSAPDYILLTLLQGHTGAACAASDSTTTALKSTVPRTAQRREGAEWATGPTRPTVPNRQSVTPVAMPTPPPAVASAVIPTGAPSQIPTVTPLPGRMTVGAPPARIEMPPPAPGDAEAWTQEQRAATLTAPSEQPVDRPMERRTAPVTAPRTASAAPPRRERSPMNAGFFTAVSRNSP